MLPPHRLPLVTLALLVSVILLVLGLLQDDATGERLSTRVPGNVTFRGDPDGLPPVRMVNAYPNLRFKRPLWVGAMPYGVGQMWVLEQDGRIYSFPNRRDASRKHLLLDISHKVYRRHNEEGLLGIAFHPQFEKNRQLFLHYSANRPRRGVISRFTMNRARTKIDPKSERVILEQKQPWGNHNGGGMEFGPDGYLYISFGDGGAANDPLNAGQDLSTWLGAMLRIDVDRKKPYGIPPDNPFVGRRDARPEIWAYGLRNVWRFSFDRLTGDLWAGDVGQNAWEEISILTKGGNFGWKVREGHYPFRGGAKRPDMIDPVISHDTSEARSITGGYVYRGRKIPELQGAYLYADYATGWVWALRYDGTKVTQHMRIGRGGAVSSFGEDAQGEVYFTAFDGRIYTFMRGAAEAEGRFPRKLSETGLFRDTKRMTPNPAMVPYDVNAPLWSDGAGKQRFIMLPGMAKITVDADGSFRYPRGTIFVKSFLAGSHRLETRVMVLRQSGWAGFTYVWNDAQDDAFLIDGRVEKDLPLNVAKRLATKRWTFPGRADCTSCHTPQAGHVLGFRSEQLQRVRDYGGGHKESQLAAMARIGLFQGDPTRAAAWPAWTDSKADLGTRVRAYLDSNCASCHRPGGTGNAKIDLRYETPLEQTFMLGEAPGQGDLGVAGAKIIQPGKPSHSLLLLRMMRTDDKGMPNLAHNAIDMEAVREIKRWIADMR